MLSAVWEGVIDAVLSMFVSSVDICYTLSVVNVFGSLEVFNSSSVVNVVSTVAECRLLSAVNVVGSVSILL